MTERQILINLIAGMCLSDHDGDRFEDCIEALKQIGIEPPAHDLDDLGDLSDWLAEHHGAKTVWGTDLGPDE